MTASMTAFARHENSGDWGRATWEIRTVNHRYLDMSIRLPDELRYLEGVTQDQVNRSIWVVEEKERAVVELDVNGNEQNRIIITDVIPAETDNFLEGISYHDGILYIVTEKNPKQLLLLDVATENITASYNLDFADDFSGISYDSSGPYLWLISDQSQTVSRCNLQGVVDKSFQLDFTKGEGVAADPATGRLFIVNDATAELYVFELPPD